MDYCIYRNIGADAEQGTTIAHLSKSDELSIFRQTLLPVTQGNADRACDLIMGGAVHFNHFLHVMRTSFRQLDKTELSEVCSCQYLVIRMEGVMINPAGAA